MPGPDDQQLAAGEDEFDAAFEAAADAKTTPDQGLDTGEGNGDDGAASDTGQDDPAQTPANEAGADTTAADTQAAADDLWANATPEQKAAFDAAIQRGTTLEHADRSNRGRLSTLQRQVNDLIASGVKPASAAPQGAARVRDMLNSDAVKTAVSDYGEANAPLFEILQAQQEVLETFQQRQDVEESARTEAYLDEQFKIVTDAHADYGAVAKSTAFTDWYRAAPDGVRDMIDRNGAKIINGAEVASVVRLFKAETGFGQTSTPAVKSQTPQDILRARQLAGSSALPNRGQSPGASAPEDFDAAWDQFAARKGVQ